MYKNSKHTVLFPLLLAAGVVLGLVLGQYLGRNTTTSQLKGMLSRMALPDNKLSYTLSLIENQYVDSVSMDSLAEHVIPMLVKELDPHSVYIPAAEMQALNEPLEGEFDGIGVVFNMATDTVIVLNVIPQGPSDKAGVKAGDRIVEIGDSLVAGRKIPQNNVVKMLRGPRGTTVRLGLERQGISDLVEVEVVRGVIPIRSIESAFRIADGVGYVKLGQFARTTFDEFRKALGVATRRRGDEADFRPAGQFGRVSRPGDRRGQRVPARGPADRLHRGPPSRAAARIRRRQRFGAGHGGRGADRRGKRLVERNSRRSVAGQRPWYDYWSSFVRQGSRTASDTVQRRIALRLTTARYYTPTGRSIQKPYTIGDDADYEEDLWNRYRNNEFFSADSIHFADSLKRVTPGGKVVYGGGGIMPDVFIPADTTDVTKYFVEVAGRNILYRYTIEYADRHREALNAVKTIDELQALLDSDKTLVDDFVRYAARKGVAPRYGDIARSRKLIEAQLRAYIGRNTALEDNGFYANIYPVDNVVVRAIGILKEANKND